MTRGSFCVPKVSKPACFAGKTGVSDARKSVTGFSAARFGSRKMLEIGPERVGFRVFGPRKLAFDVAFWRFCRNSAKKLRYRPRSQKWHYFSSYFRSLLQTGSFGGRRGFLIHWGRLAILGALDRESSLQGGLTVARIERQCHFCIQ